MQRNRTTLTEDYLAQVHARGITASELVDPQPDKDLLTSPNRPGLLSRPLFLGRHEIRRLTADLEIFRTALLGLPERIFGGDLEAFARSVGMTDTQVRAVARGRGDSITRMTRSDLVVDASGFKLMEANISSTLGGLNSAMICRKMLEHPLLSDFAAQRDLGFPDTLRAMIDTMYAETGFDRNAAPVVAMTDWPSSYETGFAQFAGDFCRHLHRMGVDAHPCHLGHLDYRDGRVWLGGRAVDIILRVFIIEDLLESPQAAALVDPLLDAVMAGHVQIFTPLRDELFTSKATLAMLSDERNRHVFSADELAVLDRVLPWSRAVVPGRVTLEDGSEVDLLEHAIDHQDELILKPTGMHGGTGIVAGWDATVTAARWRESLREASGGPFILQRRIRPVAELFPDENGDLQPWLPVWGVFTMADGYAGTLVRATRLDSRVEVVNTARGAHVGAVLHELSPAYGDGGGDEA